MEGFSTRHQAVVLPGVDEETAAAGNCALACVLVVGCDELCAERVVLDVGVIRENIFPGV